MFAHLHVHTGYSFLDGFCRPDKLAVRAKELGQVAVAITDHGNLHGIIDFYKACQKEGIHPVIGCEVYYALDRTQQSKPKKAIETMAVKYGMQPKELEQLIKDIQHTPARAREILFQVQDAKSLLLDIDALNMENYHLILLAKNEVGLKNLYHIVSDANINGFYYKPRTDYSVLKDYGQGLIGLSACLAGRIPYLLMLGLEEQAREEISRLQASLDEFYLEIQPNSIPEQAVVNQQLVQLARELHIPLVATCDSHYILKEDHEAHDVLLCIQTGKTLYDEDRLKFSNDFWLKSEEEVREGLAYLDQAAVDEAVNNTVAIAEKCQVEFEFGQHKFPVFETKGTPEEHLKRTCRQALFRYALDHKIDFKKYNRQLEYELEVICNAGFAPYFLIVQDFVMWAKNNGIPVGPGRGSAAGSLVTYLLGITALDPLQYGLLFERFLNPERTELPDIDVDFDYAYRDKVIDYVASKYGQDHVAHICTFGTIGIKMAIKDVGRALGLDYSLRDEMSKAVPDEATTIEEALEQSEVLQGYAQEYPNVFKYARAIQNLPRHVSTHASGIVISPVPMEEFTPLFVDKYGQMVTQFDMNHVAELGLVKMDFLGLKTLTIIRKTLEQIPEEIDINSIPMDDPLVYKLYQSGNTDAVFQMESEVFKKVLKDMQPTHFSDLVAAAALVRPGPLGSGMVEDYIKRKHGEAEIDYFHPDLKPVLKNTYGVMVYQEQLMQIARVMAGYTMGQSDLLRKAVGKKKPELIAEHRQYFIYGSKEKNIPGAVNKGYPEELAARIYDLIEYFGGYGFNVSHSTCYAFISYQTAWLKTYYPKEFMAAVLSMEAESGNRDNIVKYINSIREMGIKLLPPDINESGKGFTATPQGIRFGLQGIKGVGEKVLEQILAARPYRDFDDFYSKVKPNKTVMVNLIKSGAFDELSDGSSQIEKYLNRNALLKYYYEIYRTKDKQKPELKDITTNADIREYELETLGMTILGLTKWEKTPDGTKVSATGYILSVNEITDRRQRPMAFVLLQTKDAVREVVVFAKQYAKYKTLLTPGVKVKITGKKDKQNILCDSITRVLEKAG
ncbi:DNA polymerase III subunit alpha [Moorella thermoacetica]|uniref:DNA-directed DNA polymerase n=1 Tax=Neomoorella thermoacetica TaxID=1525 RepID=A0AAC9MUF8_NEOTH|nr:DNA polymerase III subunit alpha [Moorella thermoacetica]AOQ24763.1 DNA polymerase III subunit alpha [Moorella thermoacetica]TYL15699.1 DNA polymerase III subunit alpha [Moorella thermoacetica]